MGFWSLQHLKDPRSTSRGSKPPATFRLQGLATLLTVCSLESRAGFVSHRQRSWDSPFEGFPFRKASAIFRPGRTHLPLAQRFLRRRSVRPARQASVSGIAPPGSALRSHRFLSRRSPAPPMGFTSLGQASKGLDRDFSQPPLSRLAGRNDRSSRSADATESLSTLA
jgi:hypothetical protein